MIKILFTLDYEIHGNGEGNPIELMVDPTNRLMDFLDEYGAKLTIMADVAEILKFKEYFENFGKDDYGYLSIVKQLQEAIKRGHDVQLHIHSSYFNARFENGKWKKCWDDYNLANLSYERINEIVSITKKFLENTLTEVDKEYRCNIFRAANWAMMPSGNIISALKNNGIKIDTSVFKYGKRKGLVSFDYTESPSDAIPWIADNTNILIRNSLGEIYEFPIFSENMPLWSFFSFSRIYRAYLSKKHNFKEGINHHINKGNINFVKKSKISKVYSKLTSKSAMKADFNQCTGFQLIRQLKKVERKYSQLKMDIPFVTIGHSKLFSLFNQRSLKPFLKYVSQNPDKYEFAIFQDFDLEQYKNK